MSDIQISVITVVYNSEETIESTVQSVLNQSFDRYEYIVIDGGSSDKTLEIIQKHKSKLDYFKSEKDNGIYDAMNKAIKVAKGKYCIFINSGDYFYDVNTLENLSEKFNMDYDLIYGKAHFFSPSEGISYDFGKEVSNKDFFRKMPICHQAIFFKTSLFSEIGDYDTQLRIKADHEWMLRYYHLKQPNTYYTDSIIARYNMIGYAVTNKLRSIAEFKSIATKYLPVKDRLMVILKYPFLVWKYRIYKRMQDSYLLKWYRKLKYGNR